MSLSNSVKMTTPMAWIVGLLLIAGGLSISALSQFAPFVEEDFGKWLLHVGDAIFIGGLIHFLFVMFLARHMVSDVTEPLENKIADTKLLLTDSIESQGRALKESIDHQSTSLQMLLKSGISEAISKFSFNDFQDCIKNYSPSGDRTVRVMQTFAFAPSNWQKMMKIALDHGYNIELMFSTYDCPVLHRRLIEIGEADDPDGAEAKAENNLSTVLKRISKDSKLTEAWNNKRLQIKLSPCIPAVALWSIGDHVFLSWFFSQDTSIQFPHLHTIADQAFRPDGVNDPDLYRSLGDIALHHFQTVWNEEGSSTPSLPVIVNRENMETTEPPKIEVVTNMKREKKST